MRFKEHYLKEKFYKGIEIVQFGYKSYIEIYIDPTTSEIKSLVKSDFGGAVRLGIQDKPNPKIYAWNADSIHKTMKKHLNFNLGLTWYKHSPDRLTNDSYGTFDKTKNYDVILKKLKKLFPKINKVEIGIGGRMVTL